MPRSIQSRRVFLTQAVVLVLGGAGLIGSVLYLKHQKQPTPTPTTVETHFVGVHVPVTWNETEESLGSAWESNFASRCAQLKSAGVDAIRITINWKNEEPSEGVWNQQIVDYHLKTIEIAKNAGLKVMLLLRFNDVPDWARNYSNTYFVNQNGETFTKSDVNFWHLNVKTWYDRFLQHVSSTYTDNSIIAIFPTIDSGGGEAVYPANPKSFWMYDANAQIDFRTKMQTKYGTIQNANNAWGKSYGSWNAVSVPDPGTVTGQMWKDTLNWYLDTKNDFVSFVMDKSRGYFRGKEIVLLTTTANRGMTDTDFNQAVSSGGGNDEVKMGANIFWLMDYAMDNNIRVDYTYFESEGGTVVANYNLQHGNNRLWIENANPQTQPRDIVNKIKNDPKWNIALLWYDDGKLFLDDGVTPTPTFNSLKSAIALL